MTDSQTQIETEHGNLPAKFENPDVTADGSLRASVALRKLETLWFNTGTLCNLTCANCYIESSPSNDRLVYLTVAEVSAYLDEIQGLSLGTQEIGLTGGEPCMNPDLPAILETALNRGFKVLLLTNAMRPMMKISEQLLALRRFGSLLEIRVSIDHYRADQHQTERGPRSWKPMMSGLAWLSEAGFNISAAGRTYWGESDGEMRRGFAELFRKHQVDIDAYDPANLVLFPEMDETAEVPEITTKCWSILDKSPKDIMCSNSRMIVKRKGAARPTVVACTLLPYDARFELGHTLAEAQKIVKLNHPHCAKFCVLGGGSCTN